MQGQSSVLVTSRWLPWGFVRLHNDFYPYLLHGHSKFDNPVFTEEFNTPGTREARLGGKTAVYPGTERLSNSSENSLKMPVLPVRKTNQCHSVTLTTQFSERKTNSCESKSGLTIHH